MSWEDYSYDESVENVQQLQQAKEKLVTNNSDFYNR